MVLLDKKNLIPASVLLSALMLAGALVYRAEQNKARESAPVSAPGTDLEAQIEAAVIPKEGVELPIVWGDLGKRLVALGAIDPQKYQALYEARGGFTDENRKFLLGSDNGKLRITDENEGYVLNLLWALGLANKNPILDAGEMADPRYGGPQQFASTGGWTLARGNAMDHYSRHALIRLTSDEQQLVDRVSRNIFRPCCGNSTHFPDCNHGMAMLGLLELMASQGVSEPDMYRAALQVNAYWFPETYLTIGKYLAANGQSWGTADPKVLLGADYSSIQGFQRVRSLVIPTAGGAKGNGCGA